MLNIKLVRSYPKLEDGKRKLDGNGHPIIVFVYKVTGSKEELERYVKVQTDNDVKTVVDDTTGDVLYFTTNPCGLKGQLGISVNDKIYVDTTSMDLANSLIKNHGYAGQMMAREILKTDTVPQITEDTIPQENGKL